MKKGLLAAALVLGAATFLRHLCSAHRTKVIFSTAARERLRFSLAARPLRPATLQVTA